MLISAYINHRRAKDGGDGLQTHFNALAVILPVNSFSKKVSEKKPEEIGVDRILDMLGDKESDVNMYFTRGKGGFYSRVT